MLSKDTAKAEIMWSLEVFKNKYSYQSCASKPSLFAEMFKDSKTAQSLTLGKTKCRHVISYGIAPYCHVISSGGCLRKAFAVISFDEAFSDSVKKRPAGRVCTILE